MHSLFKKAATRVVVAASFMSTIFFSNVSTFAGDKETSKPIDKAIVLDVGGKTDRSFNQSGYEGAVRYAKDTGQDFFEFTIDNDSQRKQGIEKMIQKGAKIVITVGFAFADHVNELAQQYPDVKFVVIDNFVSQPNVLSVTFKEHEGSFLVGMIAAMTTETNVLGFVGGMDIPLIKKFYKGFESGAHYVSKDVKLIENYAGSDGNAWKDPAKGKEIALSQIDAGADIVYHAAGLTGNGVHAAAQDASELGNKAVFSIGVDSNQNYITPYVLTSMVKRVDNAVYKAFESFDNGTFKAENLQLGLAENGVEYAIDEYNEDFLSKEIIDAVNKAKEDIISGKIVVPYKD